MLLGDGPMARQATIGGHSLGTVLPSLMERSRATTSEEVTPACSSMKLEVLALPKEILRVFFKSLPLLGGCQEAALQIAMLDPFAWSTTLEGLDHLVEGVTPVRSAISLSLAKLLIYERLALRKLALLGSSCFRALPR